MPRSSQTRRADQRAADKARVIRRTYDRSIVHKDGRVLYFSTKRFIRDICNGKKCFICGTDPKDVDFNDEHVLPNWLLHMFNLHQRRITLPNLSQYRYGQYKVPCCQRCNSDMGRRIEEPVRRIVAGGFDSVVRHLNNEGPLLIYTWLALIFLKTHLRDRAFRMHLDLRKGDTRIAELYEWEELHHVHCVARSFHTRALFSPAVVGSLIAIRAGSHAAEEAFDYADLYAGRTIMLRMNDACVIATLNDARAALHILATQDLPRIDGPLTNMQLRELMGRAAAINMKLRERPRFATAVNDSGGVLLRAFLPPAFPRIRKITSKELGLVVYGATMPLIKTLRDKHGRLIGERVKKGQAGFLFRRDGRFIRDSIVPIPPSRTQKSRSA